MKYFIRILFLSCFFFLLSFDSYAGRGGNGGKSGSHGSPQQTPTELEPHTSRESNTTLEIEVTERTPYNYEYAQDKENKLFERLKQNSNIKFERTSSISNAIVFVDIDGDYIITLTNYLDDMVTNVLSSAYIGSGYAVDLKSIINKAIGKDCKECEIIIEQTVFNSKTVLGTNFFSNIKLITPEATTYGIKDFSSDYQLNIPIIAVEIKKNCYINANKKFGKFLTFINSKKMLRDEIVVASLISDYETNSKLKKDLPNNCLFFNCRNENEFKAELKQHKRKTVFIIGHIENGKYINTSANGENLFSIEVERLLEISKELDINIIPLGCFSANYSPTGTTTEINSYNIISILTQSILKSAYLGDIITDIGKYSNTKLLIDEKNFKNQKYGKYKKITIMKWEGSKWVVIAVLYLTDYPDETEDELAFILYGIKYNIKYFTLGAAVSWLIIPKSDKNILKGSKYCMSIIFWLSFIILLATIIT